MVYHNRLERVPSPSPILADYPTYVEPLQADQRVLAPALINDPGGALSVRAWRWWYNARAIVETQNRLDAKATAVVVVHPWGLDDGHGLRTPQPAGVAFFCTEEKNRIGLAHMREVLNPFLLRLRSVAGLVGYSMPGTEDSTRRLLYASVNTPASQLDPAAGERQLAAALGQHPFAGQALVGEIGLDPANLLASYFRATPSTDAGDRYNGSGFWQLPMPIAKPIAVHADDVVFYDGEGYPKVRDYLKSRGIRHVLLAGYATDMCVKATTCGYENLSQDFNLFLVGDATLATFPASTTPRYATQVALANAALRQLITQVGWVQVAPPRTGH